MAETPDENHKGIDNERVSYCTNVVDIFTRKQVDKSNFNHIIRLAPELDGMAILYSNQAHPGKMFSMQILCWALMNDGTVDALIPWLNKVVPSKELNDPLNGHWNGYFDKKNNVAFYSPPPYKITELKATASYFMKTNMDNKKVVQELPDTIGTHAIFTKDSFKTITIKCVISWRLYPDGRMLAMIGDESCIHSTPILAGDESLKPAQLNSDFHYFFHYGVANKLKHGDPEALAAIAMLVDKSTS